MFKLNRQKSLTLINNGLNCNSNSKSCMDIFLKNDTKDKDKNNNMKESYSKSILSPLLNSISINSYRCVAPNSIPSLKPKIQASKVSNQMLNEIRSKFRLSVPMTNKSSGVNDNKIKDNMEYNHQCHCKSRHSQYLPMLLNKTKPIIKQVPITQSKSQINNYNHSLFQYSNFHNENHHLKQSISSSSLPSKSKAYYAYTQPGGRHSQLKLNQDAYLANPNPLNVTSNEPYYSYFGVFDGHGIHGSALSQSVASFLNSHYAQSEFIGNNITATASSILSELTCNSYAKIKLSYLKAASMLKDNIIAIDSSLSGTSATVLFFIEDVILCSNIGDSRAIAITTNNRVVPLSYDHKPERLIEAERIIASGGRVERLKGDVSGPLRIWMKDEDYPGLSMSRSIGDFIAEEIGVISEPDVLMFSMKELKAKIIICATDGIWELMTYDEIIKTLNPYYERNNLEGGAKKLVEDAKEKWRKMNNGFVDDITVIVFFL